MHNVYDIIMTDSLIYTLNGLNVCSSAHLCVRQRERRHLCSHLNGVFLLLQTHLSLLLLLLQTLNCELSLHLQVFLQ